MGWIVGDRIAKAIKDAWAHDGIDGKISALRVTTLVLAATVQSAVSISSRSNP